ncbi:hypothetical protein O1R50_16955 [Glycomyces luteolus]|uniref:Uncharacterized protein n=1 Tax=Glycomyces luteolus TaxID=2670330 RepID=A0A9X3PCN4_9ACTN|nr:hypothetical protein [Glycomyces luteolus]MDA1361322.1 hypothetical protein [Glycomyces luteolus]
MPGDAHELIVQVLQDEPLTAAWLMDLADNDSRFTVCIGAETQNKWKVEKHFRLPGYMTRAFEDRRLPTELVLVCPDDLEDEPARMLEELMRTQARPYHSEYGDSGRRGSWTSPAHLL